MVEIRVKNRLDEPVMITVVVKKIMVEPKIVPGTEKIIDCEKADEIVEIYIDKPVDADKQHVERASD